jgi:uncharacterized membrane protein
MGIRTTGESAQGVARRGAAEPGSSPRFVHPLAVGVLTAVTAVAYSVFALAQYYTFRTSSYDLVIFDQAVRSYAHFEPGISIIKGVHNGFGPNFSVLGDHWSPIDASLAPLYWIHDSPQTLLVAQAVLFALAIPPLWIFTRRAFGGGPKAIAAAYLVSVAYALSWPIAGALAFDFHEVAFAPVLTAVALERLQAGRLRTALIALAALLLIKEDMGLFVAGIGLYLAVSRPRVVPRQLIVAGALVVGGVADSFIATYLLIPAFGGRSNYYWAYSALGPDVPQAAAHLITHPASSLQLLVTPEVKLYTVLWLFGAFCFLSLRSPMALATLPLLLERMLANKFPGWWGTDFQYNAYLVVVLVCAAVDGAARLDRALLAKRHLAADRERSAAVEAARPAADAGSAVPTAAGRPADVTAGASTVTTPATSAGTGPGSPAGMPRASASQGTWSVALACAAAMCLVAVILVPRFAFGPALHPAFYQRDANMRAAAAADAVVPSGVTVEAVDNLGPQLSARDTVLLWDGDGFTPPTAAPWVVADTTSLQFSFASVREQRQRVALLKRSGYKVVFKRDGYIVLHRAGSASVSSRDPSG